MNHLNSFLVEGNLTEAPKVFETPTDTPVCTFTISSTRRYKCEGEIREEISGFDVVSYGNLAIGIAENIALRDHVRVVGRLRQIRWMDEEERFLSRLEIVAEHVELISKKGETV